jgi:hypothetical protein
LQPDKDPRIIDMEYRLSEMKADDFCYVRVFTKNGNIAWSSPVWGDEIE